MFDINPKVKSFRATQQREVPDETDKSELRLARAIRVIFNPHVNRRSIYT